MPKETITPDRYEVFTPVTDGDFPGGTQVETYLGGETPKGSHIECVPQLAVHWERNSHVQLSISVSLQAAIRIGDEARELLKRTETADQVMVYSPVLERGELQNLVRQVRRARDQVFEPDE